MINSAIIQGNLTRDPETRTTTSGKTVTTFTLACNGYGDKVDFIPCVAWDGVGEIIARHTEKGKQIIVVGSIQVRNYDDKYGSKQTRTEINVEKFSFCGKKESFPDFEEV